jgi:GPI ethanolamine phosphate transferase 1
LDAIERLIEEKDYETATAQCMDWIDRSLAGLRYFQTYDWLFLRSIVSAGYVGWILYSLSFVLDLYVFGHRRRTSHRFGSPIVSENYFAVVTAC